MAALEVEVPIDSHGAAPRCCRTTPVVDKEVARRRFPHRGRRARPIGQLKRDLHRDWSIRSSSKRRTRSTSAIAGYACPRQANEFLRRESAALSATELEQIVDQIVESWPDSDRSIHFDATHRHRHYRPGAKDGTSSAVQLAREDASFRDDSNC